MNLDEFIKALRKYIDTPDAVYILARKKEQYLKAIAIVERDAKICDQQENPTFDSADVTLLVETLEHLLAVLNEQPIGEDTTKFADAYSTLLYNHNKNTHKLEKISTLSQTVNRYANLRLTTAELIQNLRKMNKQIRDLSNLSYQPAQLSKHYLASFDKKNNK
jgi:predicted ribosome quality control (RQC) complex YloA/Tae2 family protein